MRALVAGGADRFITTDERTAPLQVACPGEERLLRDWTDEEKKICSGLPSCWWN